MSLSPEDDFAAGEFALGTLDPAERATIAARRLREPELDAAIRAWEARLAPLNEAVADVAPPADLLAKIEARIDAGAPAGADIVSLQARLGRWRAAAVAAMSLAAMLAVGVFVRESGRSNAPHEFVAVLQKSADSPAFAVSVNIDTRELVVRPVAATAPAGKSYELWIIADKLGKPRSLGVIDAAAITRNPKLGAYDSATVEGATYAVTVEPEGGSPTGAPSGAPAFVGKLIPVGP